MTKLYAGLNFWVLFSIILVLIAGLIVAYIFTVKHNTKKFLKKSEKKIERDKKNNLLKESSLEEMIVKVFEDTKYKGKFNSFTPKNRKIIKRYFYQFFEYVCPYGIVKEKQNTNKYQRLSLVISKEPEFKLKKIRGKYIWVYDSSKSVKKIFKQVVKFGNKFGVMKSIVDVFSRTYKYFKNKYTEGFEEPTPQATEKDLYITMVIGKEYTPVNTYTDYTQVPEQEKNIEEKNEG